MRELLRQPAIRAGHGAFVRRIQSSFAELDEAPAAAARPVEVLTKRELEILRLIAAGELVFGYNRLGWRVPSAVGSMTSATVFGWLNATPTSPSGKLVATSMNSGPA